MIIPLLDALLPPAPGRAASNGPDSAAVGVFEALLAGLGAAQVVQPAEQPLAATSEALPPIAQTLSKPAALPARSSATLPPTGKALPDFAVTPLKAGLADFTAELASIRTNDETEQLPVASEAPPAQAPRPDIGALLPVVTAIPAKAELPLPAPFDPAASTPPFVPAPRQQPAAAPASTPQITAVILPEAVEREQPVRQIGSALPVATTSSAMPSVDTTSAPRAIELTKPLQPLAPSLTILPSSVPPPAVAVAPTSPKKVQESKLAVAGLAVSFEAPSTLVAAPVTIQPIVSLGEAAPSASQAPAQPIALPDHRALVEALVRARTERDPGVSVALETREFGVVALRFETLQSLTGERGLQVALSSGDPGFERAVASAGAAQATLADQAGRNPASRGDSVPTRSTDPSPNPFGDAPGGRNTPSDPHSQHRSAQTEAWREPRSFRSSERSNQGGDPPGPLLRDARRGSIFA